MHTFLDLTFICESKKGSNAVRTFSLPLHRTNAQKVRPRSFGVARITVSYCDPKKAAAKNESKKSNVDGTKRNICLSVSLGKQKKTGQRSTWKKNRRRQERKIKTGKNKMWDGKNSALCRSGFPPSPRPIDNKYSWKSGFCLSDRRMPTYLVNFKNSTVPK